MKDIMTAEEWLKENYSKHNNWNHYPPSENRVAEMMEEYHQYATQQIDADKLADELYDVLDSKMTAHENLPFGAMTLITDTIKEHLNKP